MSGAEEQTGIGLALAGIVVIGIALGWRQLCASPAATWLSERQAPEVIGLCVGVGFATVVVGSLLDVDTAAGSFLIYLGATLTVASLLVWRSATLQQGRGTPTFGRRRLPDWVSWVVAVLAAVLVVSGLAAAISGG